MREKIISWNQANLSERKKLRNRHILTDIFILICIEKSARCLRFQQVSGRLFNGEYHRIVFADCARGQLPVGQFVRDLSVRLTMRDHDNERAEMEPERRMWRRKPDSPRITTRAASSPSGNSAWKRFLEPAPWHQIHRLVEKGRGGSFVGRISVTDEERRRSSSRNINAI